MRLNWKLAFTTAVVTYFAACAPVGFEKVPAPDCQGSGQACIKTCDGGACVEKFSEVKTVGNGLVDILFVIDNSGSMSYEQKKIADKFPNFIQNLGTLDYRIAMTTTDVSSKYAKVPSGYSNPPRAANENGALQDGNLIQFPNSEGVYLSQSSPNPAASFYSTVQRKETLQCEQSNFASTSCPSGDERGIYAANLVIDRTADQFVRPNAHMAIIVLADEDERSISDTRSATTQSDKDLMKLYKLESYDLPETLVSKFKAKYPDKSLTVHSIIVQPGDKACVATQSSQGNNPYVRGVEGFSYAKLSQLTGGKTGDICAANYTKQLGEIASTITEQVTFMNFACRPVDDHFVVQFEPKPSYNVQAVADFDKKVLNFTEALPANTKITLTYECEPLENH